MLVDFDRIARKHCSALYRCALQLTRNSAQAWDLVQDTFERSLRHFPAQLPAAKIQSWLMVIMRNLFVDRIRSPESQVQMCGVNYDWPDLAAPMDEEECALRSERFRAEDVRACLDRLPPLLRQSYEMHEFDDLSYRDIADLLNLRVSTVGTRILRARRRLSEVLLARFPGNEEPAAESGGPARPAAGTIGGARDRMQRSATPAKPGLPSWNWAGPFANRPTGDMAGRLRCDSDGGMVGGSSYDGDVVFACPKVADVASGGATDLHRNRGESDSTLALTAPGFGRPPPVPTLMADGHRLAPGDRVGNRYRILHFVARGAVGEVYAAHDEELGATLALKTLRLEHASHAGAMARFRREVLLTRGLVHRGVCRVFDLGVHESGHGRLLFLTMEFLAGETLADRLARTGPLTPAVVHELAKKLASALAVVHRAGVVHRDLKPSNIMLVADQTAAGGERVVITDFGLACRTVGGAAGSYVDGDDPHHDAAGTGPAGSRALDACATITGTMIGSPAYMAPEQVVGRKVGPAVDIYALGVLLFEAITGRLPFQGDSPLAVAASRLERDAPAVRTLRPDLHPAWEAALARCLARDPADRFVCVDDLPRALAVAIGTEAPVPGSRRR